MQNKGLKGCGDGDGDPMLRQASALGFAQRLLETRGNFRGGMKKGQSFVRTALVFDAVC